MAILVSMTIKQSDTARFAALPLQLDDLPPRSTARWVISRKAEIVAAVRAGTISLEDACQRYALSAEEFLCWQRLIDKHGLRGLRTTRVKDYRNFDRNRIAIDDKEIG